MIKKHLSTTDQPQSKPNLEAYIEQAQSFLHTGRPKTGKRLWQKAALSAVIPLAAASTTVNAQCIVQGTYSMMFGATVAVYKILTSAGSCNTTMNNNAIFCSPGNTMNTSFLLASANASAVNASCAFYCVCGGIGGTIIIDGSDGLGTVVIPVELIRFEAKADLSHIVVEWETAAEINNSGFEILRSTDGYFFQKIAWVDGHGNTNLQQNYEWVDKDIRPNTTYFYRLNQLDFDGSNNYSSVSEVTVIDKTVLEVGEAFPNPAPREFANIEVNTPVEIEATVLLYDGRGKLVNEGNQTLRPGTNRLKIRVGNLTAGMYFAKVAVGKDTWYRKISVQ